MELTKTAKEKLGTDEVKMQIALALGKSYLTMRRWINTNHDNLTKTKSIEAITKFTGLKENEIFE
ncbi:MULTISPECIES: hypothetical protein [unclassified Flavobacterium]|jgi:hypothetical protein|uniref:hypothetical protein n=1 Tax=unclassified Flavobacterium TaxID=196869 RepID=UPI000A3D6790|nr:MULTISPECIES: hypothetical protein [unclassified Flavobacterium]MEA9414367.1 hypothetical protein [Flavobacterium sp. PL02]OUL59984.1 hypothetical protein B8T70_22705 [Flavobacterium sp. AJR]